MRTVVKIMGLAVLLAGCGAEDSEEAPTPSSETHQEATATPDNDSVAPLNLALPEAALQAPGQSQPALPEAARLPPLVNSPESEKGRLSVKGRLLLKESDEEKPEALTEIIDGAEVSVDVKVP